MALRFSFSIWVKTVFKAKSIAFLVSGFLLFSVSTFGQVPDTVYQKPSLNTGMPPAEVTPPPVIRKPPKPVFTPDTVVAKKEVKTETYKEPLLWKDRFFTGGGFGISFGTFTNIQVAPVLGFKITDWLAAGVGVTYIYYSDPFGSENFLGKKGFAQGMIYKGIFGHVEYENFSSLEGGSSADAILAGAGYRQMVSNKVGLDLMLLLNLNQSARSAYADPLIYRFGFYIEL